MGCMPLPWSRISRSAESGLEKKVADNFCVTHVFATDVLDGAAHVVANQLDFEREMSVELVVAQDLNVGADVTAADV